MAKAPPVTAPATNGFVFDDFELPVQAGPGGRVRQPNEHEPKLAVMPVGKSFLIPVAVPDGIKDEEREAVFKEAQRKTANVVSNLIRRFKKANPNTDFTARSVNDEKYGYGVRVFRVEPKAPAVAQQPLTPAG